MHVCALWSEKVMHIRKWSKCVGRNRGQVHAQVISIRVAATAVKMYETRIAAGNVVYQHMTCVHAELSPFRRGGISWGDAARMNIDKRCAMRRTRSCSHKCLSFPLFINCLFRVQMKADIMQKSVGTFHISTPTFSTTSLIWEGFHLVIRRIA